jgi:hypothetical protein
VTAPLESHGTSRKLIFLQKRINLCENNLRFYLFFLYFYFGRY